MTVHDPLNPKPGYEALRRHRWSAAGAEYFVTLNLERPARGLDAPYLLAALIRESKKLEDSALWKVRTWVVMPDHFHILFSLGTPKNLSEVLRLFKGRLSSELRKHTLRWQPGFFEHRIRESDDRLPVFLYIFLNPYRGKLISTAEKWPGYYCAHEDWSWFEPSTASELPMPEWLADMSRGVKPLPP